jgi:hypothetical protein
MKYYGTFFLLCTLSCAIRCSEESDSFKEKVAKKGRRSLSQPVAIKVEEVKIGNNELSASQPIKIISNKPRKPHYIILEYSPKPASQEDRQKAFSPGVYLVPSYVQSNSPSPQDWKTR